MACFLVPTAEAIVTGVVSKVEKKNEVVAEGKIPFSRKLKWLKNMLWGGAALLAYEHVWHGEVVPWFPFLTAAANPEDAAVMLHEMATVGVTMALLVTAAWGCIALAADKIDLRLQRKIRCLLLVEPGLKHLVRRGFKLFCDRVVGVLQKLQIAAPEGNLQSVL